MTVTRRTIGEDPGDVTVTGPDGTETALPMQEAAPGRWAVTWEAPEMGVYRLAQGEQKAVIAVGPSAPREFEETIASGDKLAPVIAPTNGGTLRLEDGAPDIRSVREGRVAAGRGWIGITPRGAHVTQDVRVAALLPGWLYLLLAAGLALGAWLREGRFGRRA